MPIEYASQRLAFSSDIAKDAMPNEELLDKVQLRKLFGTDDIDDIIDIINDIRNPFYNIIKVE
jgi:hypothetical protein